MKQITKKQFYTEIANRGKMLFGHSFVPPNFSPEKLEPVYLAEILEHQQKTRNFYKLKSYGIELKTEKGETSSLRHEKGDIYLQVDNYLIAFSPNFAFCVYL